MLTKILYHKEIGISLFESFFINIFELKYKKKKAFMPKIIFTAGNLPFVMWFIKNVIKKISLHSCHIIIKINLFYLF